MKFTSTIAIGAVLGLGITGVVYGSFALNNHLTRSVRDVFRSKGIRIASGDEQWQDVGMDYGFVSDKVDFIKKEIKDNQNGGREIPKKVQEKCEEILESQYSSIDTKTFNQATEGCRKRRTPKDQISSMKKDGENKEISDMINYLFRDKATEKESAMRKYENSNNFWERSAETFRIEYCSYAIRQNYSQDQENASQPKKEFTKEYLDYCQR